MNATLTQQFKAWQQLRRARQRNAFARHVGNRLRLGIANVEKIAHMHKAEHVIEILAGHRITGIRHFANVCGRLFDRHGTIQEHHVGTWAHHFGHNRFGRVEHVIEDRAFVLAQVRIGVDEHAQLLVGHFAVGLVWIKTKQAHNDVRILADQPNNRLAHLRKHMNRRHHGTRDLLVALHGDTLRHQLRNHDRTVRNNQRQHDGGQGSGHARRHAPTFDNRHNVWRNRRFTERCGKKTAQRHADLHGRQKRVRIACDLCDALAADILLFHLVDLRSAQTDQRQFGAGEHGTEQQEDEDQEDIQTE